MVSLHLQEASSDPPSWTSPSSAHCWGMSGLVPTTWAEKPREAALQAPGPVHPPLLRADQRLPASEEGGTQVTELGFVLELGFGSEVPARRATHQGQHRTGQHSPRSICSVVTAWGLPSPGSPAPCPELGSTLSTSRSS